MKRFAMATVVICFITVLHVMGQTTAPTTSTNKSSSAAKPTSNSTGKPTSNPEGKPATSSAANPASSSAANPTSKPKPVLYWDGTGKWVRPEGDASTEKTGTKSTDKWPSPTYEDRRSEQPAHAMNATGEFSAASQGQNSRLRCRGPEKRPCTEGEVKELSSRMAEKSSEHPALASINTLTLESPQGAISCRQVDGKFCTPEQLKSLNEHVAEPLRCEIYELALRSNPQSHTSTAQNKTPATSHAVSTTPESASPTPSGGSTTTSSNSSTQHHDSTAQNHPTTAGDHTPPPQHHPGEWQHRTSTTQKHASTTGNQNSTPPKQP